MIPMSNPILNLTGRPRMVGRITRSARKLTRKLLMVKLTGNFVDPVDTDRLLGVFDGDESPEPQAHSGSIACDGQGCGAAYRLKF